MVGWRHRITLLPPTQDRAVDLTLRLAIRAQLRRGTDPAGPLNDLTGRTLSVPSPSASQTNDIGHVTCITVRMS